MLVPLLASLLALAAAQSAATGTVSGKVALVKGGAPLPDASQVVVWIEGAKIPNAPTGVVRAEMKSERKSFQPRVIAVPRDAAVDFPNVDPIFHNVFSVSPGNRFDLGLYRSGTSKPNVFHDTGLVRVYCNIHPQMVGFVLVAAAYVPRNHLKVRLGHPMYAGIKVWAFGHFLAAGMLHDVLLFGTFLVWATVGFAASRRRDRRDGVVYPAGTVLGDVLTVIVGAALWAVFAFWLHARWIGVAPFA